jgi:hypothetical protein
MPDTEGNWFAHVTANDARAWPWVFGLLSFIFSTVVVVARVFARRKSWEWSDSCLDKMRLVFSTMCIPQLTEDAVVSYVRFLASPVTTVLGLTTSRFLG